MKTAARLLAAATAACALLRPGAEAAPARDLGLGLSYYRVHQLPSDLPVSTTGRPGPCILDLRFAKCGAADAAALRAWVRTSASARCPVLVLENAATSPALLAALPGNGPAGLIVLAPAADGLSPDIPVRVAADVDRRAYDALEKGAPVETLLSDNPEKPRVDEAYLEKEHLSDSEAPDAAARKPSPAAPLVDSMLQRAVQIHRGLLALKSI
ncbi:MAG TPA: hypothetical protein VKG78_11740 [Opitutaceae bacterium]|nr:hypothetical protein [Opitutaceae bacterium]